MPTQEGGQVQECRGPWWIAGANRILGVSWASWRDAPAQEQASMRHHVNGANG
jgi:hypothetical protein